MVAVQIRRCRKTSGPQTLTPSNGRKEDDENHASGAGDPFFHLHRPFGDGESGRCHPASARNGRGGVGEGRDGVQRVLRVCYNHNWR